MSTETMPASRPTSRLVRATKKILIGLVAIIAALAVIVAIQPADYTVTRSVVIHAPPERPFAHVNDFHQWNDWSPWAKLDPAMQTTFVGSSSGKDAAYTWKGNDKVGEGKMTITDSYPFEAIKIKLEFERPFKDTADAVFTFKPQKEPTTETLVIWSMSGKKNFIGKAFGLIVSMDKLIGADFEKGLQQLKTLAEAPPATTSK